MAEGVNLTGCKKWISPERLVLPSSVDLFKAELKCLKSIVILRCNCYFSGPVDGFSSFHENVF